MMLDYPESPQADFGLGTAYERLAIYRYLSSRLQLWNGSIRTGIEGFYDGLFGLPGLHLLPLAMRGGHVTVACRTEVDATRIRRVYEKLGLASRLSLIPARHPAELAGQQFDVAFLFNALPYLEDWRSFIAGAASLSSKRLIVSAANRHSYGVMARIALKKLQRHTAVELIDHPSTHPKLLRNELSSLGPVESEDFLDAPWWPDFCGKPGDSVASWILGQISPVRKPTSKPSGASKEPSPFVFDAESFPYFQTSDEGLSRLQKKLALHPSFESNPIPSIKGLFAHHRIFVVQRGPLA